MRCTEPQMEFQLLKEAALSDAEKRPPHLSEELVRHMEACESCGRMLTEVLDRLAAWDQQGD